jgi:hypothetical protein
MYGEVWVGAVESDGKRNIHSKGPDVHDASILGFFSVRGPLKNETTPGILFSLF